MFNSIIKKNVLANFGGKAWSGLIQLAFVPLYIKFLGMEAYGLIGFFIMLQTVLGVLDLGLSTTLTRELALRSASDNTQEARNLVRTMEWIYWPIAIVIAVGIAIIAPWIASSWLSSNALPAQSLLHTIILMGFAIAAQWPYSLYSGGLIGLQKQVLLNTVRAFMATAQAGGAVLVLWLISPSIEAFFIWQIGIVGIQTVFTGYLLRSSLSCKIMGENNVMASFSWYLLRQTWRFAAGITGISAVAIILTQMDKVILSKLLSLEQFGLYMLAFTLGNALAFLVSPVSTALFPQLSALVAEGNTEELSRLYHKGCQVVALFVFPVGILIAFFPQEILMLWIRDTKIAENAHVLLRLIVVGCLLNASVSMPYMLQLANGWTSLSFYKNIVAIIILMPLLFSLTSYMAAVGGAITWVLLNAGYVLFEIPLMHRRLISQDMWRWYIVDVGLPVACCVCVGVFFKIFFPDNPSNVARVSVLSIAYGSMFLVCAFVLPFSKIYFKRSRFVRV